MTRALLGAGVVLSAALLVLVVGRFLGSPGGEPPPTDAPPPSTASVPPESASPGEETLPPAPASDPQDRQPVRWVDAGDPGAGDLLRQGAWLVVFVDGEDAEAARTVRSANDLHRRLRGRSARLLLVFPREQFLTRDRVLVPVADRARRLRALGGASDLVVLLDPSVGPPLGGALRTRFRVRDPIAAVVVVDGRLEQRTAPLEGAFTVDALLPLARTADATRR